MATPQTQPNLRNSTASMGHTWSNLRQREVDIAEWSKGSERSERSERSEWSEGRVGSEGSEGSERSERSEGRVK